MNIPLLVVASFFFLAGFGGLLIPVIPDLPLIWLGILIYSLGTRFTEISLTTVLLLGALSTVTYLIDYLSTLLGAKRFGASRPGTASAVVGGIIGLVVFPPFGFLLGAILGMLFGELVLAKRSVGEANRASQGVLLGFLLGLIAKVTIAGLMIGFFLQAIL